MPRKLYAGVRDDKERSKKKLIDAVGTIIRTEGYVGLNASNIAKIAGLHRRLITTYFDSVDQLVETYVRGKDYWASSAVTANEDIGNNKAALSKEIRAVGKSVNNLNANNL